MKKLIWIALTFMVACGLSACGASSSSVENPPDAAKTETATEVVETSPAAPGDPESPAYQNATYEINGQSITLVDGVSEVEAAPGSASKIVTQYFGNEAFADLNGDGKEDVVFLLTQDGGGSGTFFYVVAALQTESGYQGTNAIFLGDRIAPQSTAIENGRIVVNFAERKPDEPFTTQPSVGVSIYLQISAGELVEAENAS